MPEASPLTNAAAGHRRLLRTLHLLGSVGGKGEFVNDIVIMVNNDIASVENKVDVEGTVAVVGEDDYLDSKAASPLLNAPDDFHQPKG